MDGLVGFVACSDNLGGESVLADEAHDLGRDVQNERVGISDGGGKGRWRVPQMAANLVVEKGSGQSPPARAT